MCSNGGLLRQELQDASVEQVCRQDTRQPPAPTTIVSSGDPQMADLRRCTPRGPYVCLSNTLERRRRGG